MTVERVAAGHGLKPLFSRERIQAAVRRIAREISKRYHGSDLLLVGVLKGSIPFIADLSRELTIPVTLDYLRVASYGAGTSPDVAVLTKDIETPVTGKDVLVVEDIVDTGRSLSLLARHFEGKGAKSVASCVLIDKRGLREDEVVVDFVGFRVDEGFLVGYGMDLAEAYRQLPAIYEMPPAFTIDRPASGGRR